MHSSSNSSTGVDYHLDENKSHTHARKWSSATTSSCSTDSSKESTSSTDGNGLTRTLGDNGQRFSKLLPHTPFSGTFISPLEKCSTSHSKTTSLEFSAARNETDSLAPGIAFDSLGGSSFCDILYEFNDCICLGKQASPLRS